MNFPTNPSVNDVYTLGSKSWKWDGVAWVNIKNGATTPTAAALLASIKTVDGTGSGLDADLLGGYASTYYQPASSAITIDNISLYSPSKQGTGATGTWSINISGNAATATSATGLVDDSGWMRNRGAVAVASVDTATGNGFYTQNNAGDSQGLLVFNPGGSLGPLQMTFTYGGLLQFRNKTDSTTWTAWKTVLTSSNYTTYSPSLTGSGASGTWGINITGTAATATSATSAATLTTGRNINGTTFNGSANITTSFWGTARTLTIGSTGKSVDGSANVSWTLGELGAEFVQAQGIPRSNLGDPTVREAALFDSQFNNKTDLHDISNLFIESSTDNINWTSVSVNDTNKRKLVGGDASLANIYIPYGTPYFRVRFRSTGTYVYLNALYGYFSTDGHTTQVQVFKKHDNDANWTQVTNSTTQVSSWPGHFYLPHASIPWRLAGIQGTHSDEVYVLFIPSWNSSFSSNSINIQRLQWWGGYPAGRRNLYATNEFGDASFPATITLVGSLGVGNTTPTARIDVTDTYYAGSGSLAGGVANFTQTWNTTGTPTAIKLNVTDTASNASSLLMDLQVGGSSKFKVDKSGTINASGYLVLGSGSGSAKLIVANTDASISSLRVGRTDTGSYWDVNHAGNDFRLYNTAGAGADILLGMNSAGTDVGNKVGIGTATPETKLDVVGTGRFSNLLTVKAGIAHATSGDAIVAVESANQLTLDTTATSAADSWPIATYRSAKYVVQVSQGTSYQVSEILVIQDGTSTIMTEYAVIETGSSLATFTSDVSAGNARLLVTMNSAATANIRIKKILMVV